MSAFELLVLMNWQSNDGFCPSEDAFCPSEDAFCPSEDAFLYSRDEKIACKCQFWHTNDEEMTVHIKSLGTRQKVYGV